MPNNISIFDFDRTLTKRHTFPWHSLDSYSVPYVYETIYENGNAEALVNMKAGAHEQLKHDAEQLGAIATYHNNPAFIAGFIAVLLGKKLIFKETLLSNSIPVVAINSYEVEGEEKPFLISYIPALGDAFSKTLEKLAGKNNQITFLRATLFEKGLIKEDEMIQYFDDSEENFNHAKTLSLVNSHWVDPKNNVFTVIKTFYGEPLPAKKTEAVVDDVDTRPAPHEEVVDDVDTRLAPHEAVVEDLNAKLLFNTVPKPPPISASFFMQIMASNTAKIIGGLFLIAALLALALGIVAGASGVAVGVGATVLGAGMLGVGLFGYRFFASRSHKAEIKEEEQQKLVSAQILV